MGKSAEKIYEAFRASMLANDGKWKEMIAEEVILTGPLAEIQGKEAFIAINGPFFDSIVDSVLHEMIHKSDHILTRISTSVTMPSGNVVTLEVSEWYEIKNGLIQSLRTYFDTFEFRNELGA